MTKSVVGIMMLLLGIVASGQEIRETRLTTDNGLADNNVRNIYQDTLGFLWFSTLNGLSRYDGNEIINFRPDGGEARSLTEHRLRWATMSGNGLLWVSTYSDIFNCYDTRQEEWLDLTVGGNSQKGRFRELKEMGDGSVWLWGKESGCVRWERDKTGAMRGEEMNVEHGNLPSNSITFVAQERDCQTTYIASQKGLYAYRGGDITAVDIRRDFAAYGFGSDGTLLLATRDGELWQAHSGRLTRRVADARQKMDGGQVKEMIVARDRCVMTTTNGCYEVDLKTGAIRQAPLIAHGGECWMERDNRGDGWVTDSEGELWHIVQDGNVAERVDLKRERQIAPQSRRYEHFVRDSEERVWMITPEFELAVLADGKIVNTGIKRVKCIAADRSGGVWAGTEFTGVVHLEMSRAHTLRIGDGQQTTRSMLNEGDEGLLVGSRTGGVVAYTADLASSHMIEESHDGCYALHRDREGRLWMGTRNDGIWVDGRHYTHITGDTATLSHEAVYAICADKRGRIWIGTFGGGLELAEMGGHGDIRFRSYDLGAFGRRWVRCIETDKAGRLWIGSNGGLTIVEADSLAEGEATRMRHYNRENGGLLSDEVRSIWRDEAGRMWISEAGSGFAVATVTENGDIDIRHYGEAEGLRNTMVQSFCGDDRGRTWIATEYGLTEFDIKTETFCNFPLSSTPQDNVYAENSATRLTDGRLAFGTMNGLTVIWPEESQRGKATEQVTMTSLNIGGIDIGPSDSESPLNVAMPYADRIRLTHDQNSFNIRFSLLDYTDIQAQRFTWKLGGYDKDWNTAQRQSQAQYKNVPPGEYTLMVKGCDAYGNWSDIRRLKISISSPIWQRWWAIGCYIIIGLAVIAEIWHVARRINTLNGKIRVEKELTELKLVFFTNISHEFRTPLTLILGSIEKLQQTAHMPQDSQQPLGILDKSAKRMLRLVNQLLEFRKMEKGKLSLALQRTEAVSFIADIAHQFDDVAAQKEMRYTINSTEERIDAWLDQEKVDKMVYNLISNAMKYTPDGGSVSVRTEVDKKSDVLNIIVTDTGVGIAPEMRNELFTRFARGRVSTDSIGIGLNLTKELAKTHKGDVTYAAGEKCGSTFKISLPLKRESYYDTDFLNESARVIDDEITDEEEPAVTDGTRRRVLIVEDEEDIRAMMVGELGKTFDVIEARDGAEGIDKARAEHPDLIICDVMMPRVDGLEATKRLKGDFATNHIPIILLTALSSQESKTKGINCGADDYISKPFSMTYLKARCVNIISQRDKLREKYSHTPGMATPQAICGSDKDTEFMTRLNEMVTENLGNPDLSVEQIARDMGMSRTAFFSKTKGLTGYAPVEYMRVMRLKRAAELLLTDKEVSVAETAYRVGFSDPFYFSKIFKTHFGASPSEYRKHQRPQCEAAS